MPIFINVCLPIFPFFHQIYHSFHNEVDVYRQHWWRCDGSCQKRKPYFGYVKRAMNRAPSSLDPWWEDHQRTCGGTYTKIKEPEGYGKKCKKTSKTSEKKATGSGKPSSTTTGNMPVHACVLSFKTLYQQTRKSCSYFKHFKPQWKMFLIFCDSLKTTVMSCFYAWPQLLTVNRLFPLSNLSM